MAYTGISKPYKEMFIEVDINKLDVPGKQLGIIRKGLTIEKTKFTCAVEGIKVGYGTRMYFRCEHCGERVAKLYVTNVKPPIIKCRHCIGFNYISQQATKTDLEYEFHLMKRYGRMLDPNFKLEHGLSTWCPFKPKHMHQKTYDKIRAKYIEAQQTGEKKWLHMVGWITKYR